ncbi:MAG: SDR family oxidoreductase [Chitinophagaceae bacterium]
MGRLKEKVAVITGAASGMGKATALLFASEGSKIVASDIHKERLEALEEEIKNAGGSIVAIVSDITKQEDVDKLIDTAVSEFGTLDILVNSAGIMDNFDGAADLSNTVYDRVMKINAEGSFKTIRKALSVFLPKESGVIVNIASLAGVNGGRGGVVYTMSKHAVVGLTKSTGYLYAKKGIRCNAIAPGGVESNISESIDYTKVSPLAKETIMPGTSLNPRMGKAEEIARIALFLASDESSFVNGEVIVADSGWNAY